MRPVLAPTGAAGGSRPLRIAGENLASIRGDATSVGPRAIELWLKSASHRTNLLGDEFTHSGVGVVHGEDGFWYVVQLYAAYQ